MPSEPTLIERPDETLFAWTSAGDHRYYPQFINVSRKDGRIVISVRSLEYSPSEYPWQVKTGAYATVTLPDDEAAKLADTLERTLTPVPTDAGLVERLRDQFFTILGARVLNDTLLGYIREAATECAEAAALTPTQDTVSIGGGL